jgi:hypothetical protein
MSTNARTRTRQVSQRQRRGTAPRSEPQALGGPPVARPLEASEPRGWRDAVVLFSGLNALAGVWLIIAPWVLGYEAGDPKWNDVVFGGVIVILALFRAGGAFRDWGLSLFNALVGVWLFVAAFTIDASGVASWNDVILGVIVFVFGIASATASGGAAEGRTA